MPEISCSGLLGECRRTLFALTALNENRCVGCKVCANVGEDSWISAFLKKLNSSYFKNGGGEMQACRKTMTSFLCRIQ